MQTGTIPDIPEQLYFCVYKKDDLLSISIMRPSFNRQDKESAITILTHNMIQAGSLKDFFHENFLRITLKIKVFSYEWSYLNRRFDGLGLYELFFHSYENRNGNELSESVEFRDWVDPAQENF